MIVVIQCAARKKDNAGHLRTSDGRKVMFVADPDDALPGGNRVHARPDGPSDTGTSWRTVLRDYNTSPDGNPLNLLPAWRLYENPTYELLANHFSSDRLYILSAGWGLIHADFLTPCYNITFSKAGKVEARRRKTDRYDDFRMLSLDATAQIVFFGGKDYVDLFCALTSGVKGRRYVWYNSVSEPRAPGCTLRRFRTAAKTNWHYECAKAFVDGRIRLEDG